MSEQETPSRRALVVLGVHRSGTSAMARVLGLCGARLPGDLHDAGFDNPEGFWESRGVIALDDEILSATDSEWDDVFAGRPRHYLSNFDRVFRHRAGEAVEAAFGDADLIVLKDPRINVLAGFWDGALRSHGYEPTYVVMVRHPLEVAASLLKRNGLPTEAGLLLWLDHMSAAERDTRGKRRLFVAYPDLLSSWRACVDRVEAAAGTPLPRRTGAASNEIGRFLNPDLRHHGIDALAEREFARAWPRVSEAYAWFLAASRGEEPAEAPALEAAERHLGEMSAAVGPVLADLRTRLAEHRRHAGGLEGIVADLRGRAETDAARLASAEAEQAALRAHADGLEREQAALHAHADALERERAALRCHADALEGERTRLEQVVTAAAAQAKAIEAALMAAEADLAAAQAQWEAEARGRGEAAEAALEQERARVAALHDELAAERARLADALSTEADRSRREAELEAQRARLEGALAASAGRVRQLEHEVGEAQGALTSERERLQAWTETERAGLEEALAAANSRSQQVESESREAQAALALEREWLGAAHAEMEALRRAVEAQAGLAASSHAAEPTSEPSLARRLEELDEARGQAEAEAAFYARRCEDLRAETSRLQLAAEAAIARSHVLDGDLASARAERDRLANELWTARRGALDEARRHENELADLILARDQLSEQLAEAHGRRKEVEAETAAQIEALLAQREAMVNSTAWRLTSTPRRLLARLRRG